MSYQATTTRIDSNPFQNNNQQRQNANEDDDDDDIESHNIKFTINNENNDKGK